MTTDDPPIVQFLLDEIVRQGVAAYEARAAGNHHHADQLERRVDLMRCYLNLDHIDDHHHQAATIADALLGAPTVEARAERNPQRRWHLDQADLERRILVELIAARLTIDDPTDEDLDELAAPFRHRIAHHHAAALALARTTTSTLAPDDATARRRRALATRKDPNR